MGKKMVKVRKRKKQSGKTASIKVGDQWVKAPVKTSPKGQQIRRGKWERMEI